MRFFGALLILVLFGVWILKDNALQTKESTDHSRLINEEFSNVHLVRYNKEGKLTQIVNVQRWVHYRGESEIKLFKPKLQLNQEDQAWHIFSDEGRAFQTKIGGPLKKVNLKKNVQVHYENKKDNGWELETESLSLFPDRNTASTNSWVEINGDNYHLRAKGMQANLNDENINFNNSVSGEFEYDS
jgi:LPS export ABC transporter protein LptC